MERVGEKEQYRKRNVRLKKNKKKRRLKQKIVRVKKIAALALLLTLGGITANTLVAYNNDEPKSFEEVMFDHQSEIDIELEKMANRKMEENFSIDESNEVKNYITENGVKIDDYLMYKAVMSIDGKSNDNYEKWITLGMSKAIVTDKNISKDSGIYIKAKEHLCNSYKFLDIEIDNLLKEKFVEMGEKGIINPDVHLDEKGMERRGVLKKLSTGESQLKAETVKVSFDGNPGFKDKIKLVTDKKEQELVEVNSLFGKKSMFSSNELMELVNKRGALLLEQQRKLTDKNKELIEKHEKDLLKNTLKVLDEIQKVDNLELSCDLNKGEIECKETELKKSYMGMLENNKDFLKFKIKLHDEVEKEKTDLDERDR